MSANRRPPGIQTAGDSSDTMNSTTRNNNGGYDGSRAAFGPLSPNAESIRGSVAAMELLRTQNTQLTLDNEKLKQQLADSERDHQQDVRYMRALLGRRLCRDHAQSWKLRKLLIKLHTQVLDLAQVINAEQRVSEINDNCVLSVQDGSVDANGASTLHEQSESTQRQLFLYSLIRLRPGRVSLALQENLERLFENMNDIIRRCPKYRAELNGVFTRNIQLKDALLTEEKRSAQLRARAEELEQLMEGMNEEKYVTQRKNEKLFKKLEENLDKEKKKRLSTNQSHVKARTTLYKKILADNTNPLHPSVLSKTGRNGVNLLDHAPEILALPSHSKSKSTSDADSHQQYLAQLSQSQYDYYLERLAAQREANGCGDSGAEYDSETSPTHESSAAANFDPTKLQPIPSSFNETEESGETYENHTIEKAADDQIDSYGDEFNQQQQSSHQHQQRDSPSRHLNEAKDNSHSPPSSVLPPILANGGGPKSKSLSSSVSQPNLLSAAYHNPFYSPMRLKPSASYAKAAQTEVAYRNSKEYQRAQQLAHIESVTIAKAKEQQHRANPNAPQKVSRHNSLLHPLPSPSLSAVLHEKPSSTTTTPDSNVSKILSAFEDARHHTATTQVQEAFLPLHSTVTLTHEPSAPAKDSTHARPPGHTAHLSMTEWAESFLASSAATKEAAAAGPSASNSHHPTHKSTSSLSSISSPKRTPSIRRSNDLSGGYLRQIADDPPDLNNGLF